MSVDIAERRTKLTKLPKRSFVGTRRKRARIINLRLLARKGIL